jgi:hypothetical protein
MSLLEGDLRVFAPRQEIRSNLHGTVLLLLKWTGTMWVVFSPFFGFHRMTADHVLEASRPLVNIKPRDEKPRDE